MTLTRAQRSNLRKLADYLESLPKGYRHFDMALFLDDNGDEDAILEYARKNGGVRHCGTSACAVGHGPAAGILFRLDDLEESCFGLEPNWDAYSRRFVPKGTLFDWAFGGYWSGRDNHHWGAAARIRYLLKHGKPPAGFGFAARRWRQHYREFDKRYPKVPA